MSSTLSSSPQKIWIIFHLFFKVPLFQCTGRTKYGMSTFDEVRHREPCNSVPVSSRLESVCRVPFSFWSWSEKWPMTWRELLCIFSHMGGIGETYLFVLQISPCGVVVHRHEDDSALELLCVTSQGFHKVLISWRICTVVNPGKIIHSNSIGSPSIPSDSLYCLNLKPIQFGFLFFVWLWELTDFPKTQRIWEYINFCLWEIDHLFIVRQGHPFPCRRSRTCFWHSWDFQSFILESIFFWVTSNNLFTVGFSSVYLDGVQVLWVISCKKNSCVHWWRHECSPNKRKFINVVHLIP